MVVSGFWDAGGATIFVSVMSTKGACGDLTMRHSRSSVQSDPDLSEPSMPACCRRARLYWSGLRGRPRGRRRREAHGLLFPAVHGAQLAPSTLYQVFYPAREKAGRAELRFHDLRHIGAVLAASTGTLAGLMARLGHSMPGAALRDQHAAQDRARVIVDALSKLVGGDFIPIDRAL